MIICYCSRRGGAPGWCGRQHDPPVPGGRPPGGVLGGMVLQVRMGGKGGLAFLTGLKRHEIY